MVLVLVSWLLRLGSSECGLLLFELVVVNRWFIEFLKLLIDVGVGCSWYLSMKVVMFWLVSVLVMV